MLCKAHTRPFSIRAPVSSFSTQCKLTSWQPQHNRSILKPLFANSGDQEVSLEKVLLDELIASRRQVDTLLHQQNVLLSLVARGQVPSQAEATSPAQGPFEPSLQPSSPSAGQNEQHTSVSGASGAAPWSGSSHIATPRASAPSSSSGNPVADILRQSGAVPKDDGPTRAGGGSDPVDNAVLSHIQAALSAVEESDVLADLPASMLPSSRGASSGAASTPRSQAQPGAEAPSPSSQAQPAVEPPNQMVPQPELASSGVSLSGEAGELVPLPLLKLGDTSAFWVEILQVALMALGLKAADEGFTYGPATESTVKRFQALNQLPETGTTDASTWASLLSKLPQLRVDIIRKVASGAAAAVVDWGRSNASNNLISMAGGSAGGSERSTGSASPSSSSSIGASVTADLPSSSGFSSSSSSSSSSGGAAQGSEPVGVNFFSDISEMAAEEAREEAEKNTSAANSSTSRENDKSGNNSSGGSNSGVSSSRSSSKGMPELSLGDDDIEWVSVLHRGLQSAGYYPSDDECENWLFGEGTQEALLTLQACSGLPETGIVDSRTWEVLLSTDADLRDEAHSRAAAARDRSPEGASTAGAAAAPGAGAATTAGGSDEQDQEDQEGWMEDLEAARALSSVPSGGKWPVLTEMEGGKDVQLMQLALNSQGYNCGEDDMQYWMFGEMTGNALRTFQACAGLKETGVCEERTWKALLGQNVSPEDLPALRERLLKEALARGEIEDFVEDITESKEGKVWLLGEQRWETR